MIAKKLVKNRNIPIFLLMAGILCVSFAPAAVRADDEDVMNCVARGNQYLARDKVKEALGEFNNAVDLAKVFKLETQFPLVYFNRARAYERLKKTDEAIADYTKAIELDKNYMLCYYNRGVLYQRMGMLDQAILDYNAMVAIDPKQVHAINNRGLIFLQKGDAMKALSDFSDAIQIGPSTFNLHFNRALAYLKMRDYVSAKMDLFAEKEKHPHSVSAGLLYFSVENYLDHKYGAAAQTIKQLHQMGYNVGGEFISDINAALGKQEIKAEASNYGLKVLQSESAMYPSDTEPSRNKTKQ